MINNKGKAMIGLTFYIFKGQTCYERNYCASLQKISPMTLISNV